jgi:CRP-like cAMP-binding protein
VESRTGNSLLDALPAEDFAQIESSLKLISLTSGQVLSRQGEPVDYVYFPKSGLVSCRASASEGETIEIYAVGYEGVVEPAAILTSVAPVTAEVQIAGEAFQIRVDELCRAFTKTKQLPKALLKYAYSLAVRMVQSTKCVMFHTVKQRLIVWLLIAQRSHGRVIPCTHEALADALGTRRATVTVILDSLARNGILELERGRVTIQNRSELEKSSCECFRLIEDSMEPVLECDPHAESIRSGRAT